MSSLYQIITTLNKGEFYVIPVLLLLFLIYRKRKPITGELLISYNHLSLFLFGVYFINFLFVLYAAWSNTSKYEHDIFFRYRISGPYSWAYWLQLVINILVLTLLCFKKWRLSPWFAFVVFFFAHLGLWMERLMIFLTSLYRDYLPSSWSTYYNFTEPILSIISFFTVLLLIHFLRKSKLLSRDNKALLKEEP